MCFFQMEGILQHFYLDKMRSSAFHFQNDTKRFFLRLHFEAFKNRTIPELITKQF